MTHRIHPTAAIHPKAQLAEGVEVGPYAVIGEAVWIGARTRIGAHVVIEGCVKVGVDNQIFPGAAIGLAPQDVSYRGAESWVEIGDRNQIREYVTIHRPTQAENLTRIGHDNFLMAYTHIAHNCWIEDDVTIANTVGLGGYVHVESKAVIGGMTGVHQKVHIGQCAMVGGMSRINRDVPPYTLVEGNPVRVRGLNKVGLRRNGILPDSATFQELKQVYRLLYRSSDPFAVVLAHLADQPLDYPSAHLIQFLQQAQQPGRRGTISGRGPCND
ncbi:MAG: acyl-ACP--UDP-N-acetylglucosamine O-acyltransferase [Thermosynechococcaceae cyanobacterium]